VPQNFHANQSPKLIQHISVNAGFYTIIFCPTLYLGKNQVDYVNLEFLMKELWLMFRANIADHP